MNQEEFSIITSSPSKSKPTQTLKDIETGNNRNAITFTLVSSTVGIVSIFMPKLFLTTGLFLGSFLLVLSGICAFLTCYMLCAAARVMGVNSFPDLCFKVLGKYARYVEILYAMFLLGNIISNHVFVAKSYTGVLAHSIFPSIIEGSEIYVDFTLFLLICINIAIVPFIVSEDLTALKKISKLSGAFLLTAFFVVFCTWAFPGLFGITIPEFNASKMNLVDWQGLKNTCGMLFLSMSVHPVVLDIHGEMKPQSASQTFKLIRNNAIFSFLLFFGFGVFGYLAVFQDDLVEQVNNYFLFFLAHKKIHSSILRIAQSMITFSFLVGTIFGYIPLIKIFLKIFENQKKVSGGKNSKIGNDSDLAKNEASESKLEIKPTPLDAGPENLETSENSFQEEPIDNQKIKIKDFEAPKKIKKSKTKKINENKLEEIFKDVALNEEANNYKKIALGLEGSIVFVLFLIIKNRVPLYVLYNIVSAVCYPTMCLMIPGIIYLQVFSTQRELKNWEKYSCYGVIGFGSFMLLFMVNNLFG